jgi:hypothetical protein
MDNALMQHTGILFVSPTVIAAGTCVSAADPKTECVMAPSYFCVFHFGFPTFLPLWGSLLSG